MAPTNRYEELIHYLDDPANMDRLQKELLTAMRDPDYTTPNKNMFDWYRFAHAFTAPVFDPCLDASSFFSFILRPHFAPAWHTPPRDRIWWLVQLVKQERYPLAWLQQQQIAGQRGTPAKIAKELDCFAVTAAYLAGYLCQRRPPVPIKFQRLDISILAIMDTTPAGIWGLTFQSFTNGRLIKKAIFCAGMDLIPHYQSPPPQSLWDIVEPVITRHNFQPNVTLFYPDRPISRETGQVIWAGVQDLADRTPGPVVVERWDEAGWPAGRRIGLEE